MNPGRDTHHTLLDNLWSFIAVPNLPARPLRAKLVGFCAKGEGQAQGTFATLCLMNKKSPLSKLKKLFLIVSAVEIAIWFVVPVAHTIVYLSLPLGAVIFGLFLIVSVLEKETALYDAENQIIRPQVPAMEKVRGLNQASPTSRARVAG